MSVLVLYLRRLTPPWPLLRNCLKGKSNTGEGGEDPMRFGTVKSKTDTTKVLGDVVVKKHCRRVILYALESNKLLPGRSVVTAEYLSTADQTK